MFARGIRRVGPAFLAEHRIADLTGAARGSRRSISGSSAAAFRSA
jgi:hypothetical protein